MQLLALASAGRQIRRGTQFAAGAPAGPPLLPMPTDVVTTLLSRASEDMPNALDELFPLVYEELRRRAHAYLSNERTEHTLSTTALVHEAYLDLVDVNKIDWKGRGHFLAVASRAMRRVLVDSARRHRAGKRGGGAQTVSLDEAPILSLQLSAEMIALDDALQRLAIQSERLARIVELRFFGGLTIAETAQALGVADSTVDLDWQKAKAWLYRDLRES